MTNFTSLKSQYNALESMCFPQDRGASTAAEPVVQDFREHMIRTVLYVWSGQAEYHEDYERALSVIPDGSEASEGEIRDDLRAGADLDEIPMFEAFVSLTVGDAAGNTNRGKEFVDLLGAFLTDMAFVGGDCTPAEAERIETVGRVHMDFYREYMLTRRRVKEGGLAPGVFTYDRHGALITYAFDGDGNIIGTDASDPGAAGIDVTGIKVDGNDVVQPGKAPDQVQGKLGKPTARREQIPRSKFRLPEELFQIDMRSGKEVGVTEMPVYGFFQDEELIIIGQLFAKYGLQEECVLVATLYDREGDVLEQELNQGYGGGSMICSTVRIRSFFQGYPFSFYFFPVDGGIENVSKIKIAVQY